MIDLVEKPDWAHKLLDLSTRLVIDWLKAQHKAMGNTVEGICILDDIVGFVCDGNLNWRPLACQNHPDPSQAGGATRPTLSHKILT